MSDAGLKATAWGEPLDPARHVLAHEVKAITYHGLGRARRRRLAGGSDRGHLTGERAMQRSEPYTRPARTDRPVTCFRIPKSYKPGMRVDGPDLRQRAS